MNALYKIVGILASLYGGWLILMCFAFSRLVDPGLSPAARSAEQTRILASGSGTIGFGIVVILLGMCLAFGKPRRKI